MLQLRFRGLGLGSRSWFLQQRAPSIIGTVHGPGSVAPLTVTEGVTLEAVARRGTQWTMRPGAPLTHAPPGVGSHLIRQIQNPIPMLGFVVTGVAGADGGALRGAMILRTQPGCPSWHPCWVH